MGRWAEQFSDEQRAAVVKAQVELGWSGWKTSMVAAQGLWGLAPFKVSITHCRQLASEARRNLRTANGTKGRKAAEIEAAAAAQQPAGQPIRTGPGMFDLDAAAVAERCGYFEGGQCQCGDKKCFFACLLEKERATNEEGRDFGCICGWGHEASPAQQ